MVILWIYLIKTFCHKSPPQSYRLHKDICDKNKKNKIYIFESMYSFLSNDKQRNAVVNEHIGNIKKTKRKKTFIQPKTDKKNVEKTIVNYWFFTVFHKNITVSHKKTLLFLYYIF